MSKTILFSLCWVGEPHRLKRYEKWLDYNLKNQSTLGWDEIILVDNASPFEELRKLGGRIYNATTGELLEINGDRPIKIYRFHEFLARISIWDYPYCWRGLEYMQQHIIGPEVDKIICLDSDFYALTYKIADYIKNLTTGWVAFWCPKYGFPETAFHVICKDAFSTVQRFPIPSYSHYKYATMEVLLPFTLVNKDFIGDRYGEGDLPQTVEMDFYGQTGPDGPNLEFDLASKKK